MQPALIDEPIQRVAQLLYSPLSGGFSYRKLKSVEACLEEQGYQVVSAVYDFSGHTKIAEDIDELVIMGGDGTIRHAIQHALSQSYDRPFSIVSCGTINLLSRNLRVCELAQHDNHLCYSAEVNRITMLNCASIGPDAVAVANTQLGLKRAVGRLAYVISAVAALVKWRPRPLEVIWPHGRMTFEAIYLAKSLYFAGPWSISMQACITKPRIEVAALRRCRRRDFLLFAASTITGHRWRNDNIILFSATWLEIITKEAVTIQIDGDPFRLIDPRFDMSRKAVMLKILDLKRVR